MDKNKIGIVYIDSIQNKIGIFFIINFFFHFFARFCLACFCTMSSTIEGSARVDVSPSSEVWLAAIFRRMRRIILPERVLGRPGTICKRERERGRGGGGGGERERE